jgi:hypothetical protein
MNEKLIGQMFYLSFGDTGGVLGFSGRLLAIDGPLWTFRTLDDVIMIVNIDWVKSLRPIEEPNHGND